MVQGWVHNPNVTPSGYPTKIIWFVSTYSTHHTAKFSDWPVCQIRQFSVVKIYFMISQPMPTFTQQYFNLIYFLHIHTQQAFHICCMYLWVYATKGTVQLG